MAWRTCSMKESKVVKSRWYCFSLPLIVILQRSLVIVLIESIFQGEFVLRHGSCVRCGTEQLDCGMVLLYCWVWEIFISSPDDWIRWACIDTLDASGC